MCMLINLIYKILLVNGGAYVSAFVQLVKGVSKTYSAVPGAVGDAKTTAAEDQLAAIRLLCGGTNPLIWQR